MIDETWNSIASNVPQDSLIHTYLRYTLEQESPTIFHFWTIVSCIGVVCDRGVHFNKGHYDVNCNHFICLVAPSGKCRKSSALHIGRKLLQKLSPPRINMIAKKVTPEALIDSLKLSHVDIKDGGEVEINSAGFIMSPELTVFIGKQSYNEGLIDILTDLADNPDYWDYKTRGKGLVILNNVNLSMIGATTPEKLMEGLPPSAFTGGFMSRIIFVFQDDCVRSFPFPPPPDNNIGKVIISGLERVRGIRGGFTNSQDGLDWFNEWYDTIRKMRTADPKMGGFVERTPDHVIRLAMIMAIAEGKGLTLTADLYQRSYNIVEYTSQFMLPKFTLIDSTYGEGRTNVTMIDQLEHVGSITHEAWLAMNINRMGAVKFGQAVATLLQAGKIQRDDSKEGLWYRIVKGS